MSRKYQLNDSAVYYFDKISEIGAINYRPTDQDILRSRVKTTGMTEENFMVGTLRYSVCDVGGQRSERKKWIHCFQNVHVLIFLVAISEYDQVLYEDKEISRMNESAGLFESVTNSTWFSNTSVILFLNKTDLFRQKLLTSPMEACFADYTEGASFEGGCAYIKDKFVGLYQNGSVHPLHVEFTCATNTEQLRTVFNAVENNILMASLSEAGLM
ncbi:hypothetical protein RQP46_002504 [Phenoliferia psychrophenolica]